MQKAPENFSSLVSSSLINKESKNISHALPDLQFPEGVAYFHRETYLKIKVQFSTISIKSKYDLFFTLNQETEYFIVKLNLQNLIKFDKLIKSMSLAQQTKFIRNRLLSFREIATKLMILWKISHENNMENFATNLLKGLYYFCIGVYQNLWAFSEIEYFSKDIKLLKESIDLIDELILYDPTQAEYEFSNEYFPITGCWQIRAIRSRLNIIYKTLRKIEDANLIELREHIELYESVGKKCIFLQVQEERELDPDHVKFSKNFYSVKISCFVKNQKHLETPMPNNNYLIFFQKIYENLGNMLETFSRLFDKYKQRHYISDLEYIKNILMLETLQASNIFNQENDVNFLQQIAGVFAKFLSILKRIEKIKIITLPQGKTLIETVVNHEEIGQINEILQKIESKIKILGKLIPKKHSQKKAIVQPITVKAYPFAVASQVKKAEAEIITPPAVTLRVSEEEQSVDKAMKLKKYKAGLWKDGDQKISIDKSLPLTEDEFNCSIFLSSYPLEIKVSLDKEACRKVFPDDQYELFVEKIQKILTNQNGRAPAQTLQQPGIKVVSSSELKAKNLDQNFLWYKIKPLGRFVNNFQIYGFLNEGLLHFAYPVCGNVHSKQRRDLPKAAMVSLRNP